MIPRRAVAVLAMVCGARAHAADASCGARGESQGQCDKARDGEVLKPSSEQVLLQRFGHMSTANIAEEAMENIEDGGQKCTGMPDVERSCSDDGCRVLATNMRGKTCNEYCGRSGRKCVSAAEEVEENCQVKANLKCDQTYGQTSDLICQCARAVTMHAESQGKCEGMQDVEKVCSSNGCRVLATGMRGRTCDDYCAQNGRTCVDAAEEVEENCEVKSKLRCDQSYGTTSDLLCQCSTKTSGKKSTGQHGDKLVWSDEFNGGSVDQSKWGFVTGGGGFGNKELQHYTGRWSNARVEHGHLKIVAKCEDYGSEHYTSAKMQTKGKHAWGPGHRVEVRARAPTSKGTWPAIWMLPQSNAYGGWPKSGEIDIMEAVGCTDNTIYGTVHTEAYNHRKNTQKMKALHTEPGGWHTYSVVWTSSRIQWFLDGHLYHSFSPQSHSSDKWPFDHSFYLILNVAVGGEWGGYCLHGWPSCSSNDEFGHDQVMEVDYARVYALGGALLQDSANITSVYQS